MGEISYCKFVTAYIIAIFHRPKKPRKYLNNDIFPSFRKTCGRNEPKFWWKLTAL